ncbi:hypothetical protein [Halobacillus litoralis]|uniref:Uncharacterized protein n=1 Tax=Halobacillus litoralis TaxID=45668 RepID=A0A410MBK7_9BACI|nr:hypothetical protein [Halobacillus litoralis]QAS52070.1 hypothetical protein HLI_07450 [Halobacillus litoralis]
MGRSNYNGKTLYYIGLFLFVAGFGINITDAPEPFSLFVIPLMIVGLILLAVSSIYRKRKKDSE